jgi:hypothetical protein
MHQIYPTSSRVLEPWHWFQVEYIRPKVDISNASDISGPRLGLEPWQPDPVGYI